MKTSDLQGVQSGNSAQTANNNNTQTDGVSPFSDSSQVGETPQMNPEVAKNVPNTEVPDETANIVESQNAVGGIGTSSISGGVEEPAQSSPQNPEANAGMSISGGGDNIDTPTDGSEMIPDMPPYEDGSKKKEKKVLLIGGVIAVGLILIAGAGGGYYYYNSLGKNNPDKDSNMQAEPNPVMVEDNSSEVDDVDNSVEEMTIPEEPEMDKSDDMISTEDQDLDDDDFSGITPLPDEELEEDAIDTDLLPDSSGGEEEVITPDEIVDVKKNP